MIKPEYPNQMQVYFITRGKDNAVAEWIKHLSGKWCEYEYNGQRGALEVIVRPIQLWEIAFPQPAMSFMMNTLFDGQPEFGRHQSTLMGNAALLAMRTALGAKEFPSDIKMGPEHPKFPMPRRDGMSVMGIGFRYDKENTHPETGIKNEGI